MSLDAVSIIGPEVVVQCLSLSRSKQGQGVYWGQTDLYLIELIVMRLQNNLERWAHYHPVLH